jgi:8-oxo-dGTP diphosphatase
LEKRYKSMIVVDLILTREENGKEQVLLALRKNTGYNDGKYELPGGHVEENEDLMEAMIREAKEELCINLKRENLKIEHILHHFKGNRLKFIISTKEFDGDLKIGEPDKCEKIQWFNIDCLPNNLEERVKKELQEIKKGIFYDNSNWENLE